MVRHSQPILTPNKALSEVRVFNPSVIVKGKRLAMLYRAEVDGSGRSQIQLTLSDDGERFTPYTANPVLSGNSSFDQQGAEDPRVVRFNNLYYMTYVCNREHGSQQQCMATSRDLVRWDKKGVVLSPLHIWDAEQVKAAVIVPKKINGQYIMYFLGQMTPWHTSLGMAVSHDLLHWTEPLDHPILTARMNHFDSLGVEPGATPIILPSGILLIYNGWNAEHVHKTGWVLFSKRNPTKVLARSEVPIIEPQFSYEIEGRNAFTFTEGVVFFKRKWRFYYGAADRAIGLGEIEDLNALLKATTVTGDRP